MAESLTQDVRDKRKRVLSGMRPTGRLHIGHYFGALQNWVKLQEQYDCFYFVADWHALTTDYADASELARNTIEIGTDWLAAGLDPNKCTLFIQSEVPEHAELHLMLSMVTPLGWLERVPTYKEQLEQIKEKDLHTYGFLGYPLLQTADIVIYDAHFVPVGEDQVPHVEMSREVVRRFNTSFARVDAETRKLSLDHRLSLLANQGMQVEQILREPDVLLTDTPRLPGTDGRKMSKSYDNYINLSESDDSIREKTRNMLTDPARKRRTDKGNPDVCPVFAWHKLFSPQPTIEQVNKECRTAEIGCVDCKKMMADNLVKWIEPIRARRQEYEAHPQRVLEILDAGSKKARAVAQDTIRRVREAIFGWQAERKRLSGTAVSK
jgi:tryptophanyl-tRNA synthetase